MFQKKELLIYFCFLMEKYMEDKLLQNPKVMSESVVEFCKEYLKENTKLQSYQEKLLLNSKKWRKVILKHGRTRK